MTNHRRFYVWRTFWVLQLKRIREDSFILLGFLLLIHAVFEWPVPLSVKEGVTISIFDSVDQKLRHPILQREPPRRLQKRPSAIRSGMTLRMTRMTLPHTTKISKTSRRNGSIRWASAVRGSPSDTGRPAVRASTTDFVDLQNFGFVSWSDGSRNFFSDNASRPHVICHF
jgi:hypothetical protein